MSIHSDLLKETDLLRVEEEEEDDIDEGTQLQRLLIRLFDHMQR